MPQHTYNMLSHKNLPIAIRFNRRSIVRRYSCTVYIVVVVCNVNSLYKSQERRLSYCCSATLQPTTSCVKYIIVFGQIILIFSRRGLGPLFALTVYFIRSIKSSKEVILCFLLHECDTLDNILQFLIPG